MYFYLYCLQEGWTSSWRSSLAMYLSVCPSGRVFVETKQILQVNNTANDVLRDAVHRLYQGVLYCQNGLQFHGAHLHVISCRALRQYATFPVPILTKLRSAWRSCLLLHKSDIKHEQYWCKINYAPKNTYDFNSDDFYVTKICRINFCAQLLSSSSSSSSSWT
jgi:hypothetical protein